MSAYVVTDLAMWCFSNDPDEIKYRVEILAKALQQSYALENFSVENAPQIEEY